MLAFCLEAKALAGLFVTKKSGPLLMMVDGRHRLVRFLCDPHETKRKREEWPPTFEFGRLLS